MRKTFILTLAVAVVMALTAGLASAGGNRGDDDEGCPPGTRISDYCEKPPQCKDGAKPIGTPIQDGSKCNNGRGCDGNKTARESVARDGGKSRPEGQPGQGRCCGQPSARTTSKATPVRTKCTSNRRSD
jgi:hypothetical protein